MTFTRRHRLNPPTQCESCTTVSGVTTTITPSGKVQYCGSCRALPLVPTQRARITALHNAELTSFLCDEMGPSTA